MLAMEHVKQSRQYLLNPSAPKFNSRCPFGPAAHFERLGSGRHGQSLVIHLQVMILEQGC